MKGKREKRNEAVLMVIEDQRAYDISLRDFWYSAREAIYINGKFRGFNGVVEVEYYDTSSFTFKGYIPAEKFYDDHGISFYTMNSIGQYS